MKIKLNNSRIFMAEEMPWLIAIMLVLFIFAFVAPGLGMAFDGVWQGLLFALAGGGMGFAALCVFVERLQVILDAQTGLITLRRRTVLKYEQTILPLDALLGAKSESTTSRREGGTRRVFRPALVLSEDGAEKTYPITQIFSNGGSTDRLVEAINAWLSDHRQAETRNI